MRFVITGEWKTNSLLRLIIALFLVFVILLWVTNAALFFAHMSLDPEVIKQHYLGTKSAYSTGEPRSYKVMMEVSHSHLFGMAMIILTLTHLLLFIPAPSAAKAWLTIITFSSALLDESAGWLIRYVHPEFAWFKLAMFLLFQLATLGIVVLLIMSLSLRWRNAYTDSDRKRKPDAAE